MYYRFPVSLAFGIVTVASIPPNSLAIESNSIYFNSDVVPLLIAQIDTETVAPQKNSPLQPIPGNYESYLQAARQAEMSGHYQQAVEYYQQALNLSPENNQLKTSLRNVIGYAFDSYMQAGYAADRFRNYSEALNNFRQALKLKPDSFHAQQAIRNITNYLTLNRQLADSEETNQNSTIPEKSDRPSSIEESQTDQWIESNKNWFFWGIAATSIISILLLINLFRSEQKTSRKHSKIVRRVMSEPTPPATSQEIKPPDSKKSAVRLNSPQPSSSPAVNPEVINNNLNSPVTPSVQPNPLPEPSATVVSTGHHQLLDSKTNSINRATVRPVTIVTSNTTKIDLVFELIKDLQQGDREVRRKAIWELAQKSDSRGIIPLIEIMPQVDSLERNLILEAITQITSRTLQPMNRILLESLEDDNPQVRKNAIRDLTRLYQLMSQVTKRLSRMTEDVDLEVQQTARWALQQLDRLPAAKQAMQQAKNKE
ncbi:MAG: tetratricopeptide repeat protein [Pleurocapsa sp.]